MYCHNCTHYYGATKKAYSQKSPTLVILAGVGSVFSTDEGRADRVAACLEVGMTHVNTIAAEAAELPFGGVKRSGFGREMGPIGMGEFVNKRLHFIAK